MASEALRCVDTSEKEAEADVVVGRGGWPEVKSADLTLFLMGMDMVVDPEEVEEKEIEEEKGGED